MSETVVPIAAAGPSARLEREAVIVEISRRDGRKGPADKDMPAEARLWGPGHSSRRALHEAHWGELVERHDGGDFPAAA
ncbi:MAG TPA: hypothetical protein VKA89_08800 [Solirubrobacterales bacterium]|nr:hypothetical protein [Solirubrobacterales bacterium]